MQHLIFTVLLLLAAPVRAGSDHGNAGHTVVCGDKVEALDIYEARVSDERQVQMGAPTDAVEQKIALVLSRLAVDRARQARYRQGVADFWTKVRYVSNPLTLVPDTGPLQLEPGCFLRQLIIQKPSPLPLKRIYEVYAPDWERLDNDSRAALILHEVIYGEALALGHRDSALARLFNESLMTPGVIDRMTTREYFRFIQQIQFKTFEQGSVSLEREDAIHYDADGFIDSVRLHNRRTFKPWPGWELSVYQDNYEIAFHPRGGFFKRMPADGIAYLGGASCKIGGHPVRAYPNGKVKSLSYYGCTQPPKFTIGGKEVTLEPTPYDTWSAQVRFSESGELECGPVKGPHGWRSDCIAED